MHSARALSVLAGLGLLAGAGCAAERGTIGAVIAQTEERRLFLRQLPKGLAADRAGLEPGDEILLIDGRDVRQMSTEQVHIALSGEVGAPVKLTLVRGEQIIRVTLQRTKAKKLGAYGGPEPGAAGP